MIGWICFLICITVISCVCLSLSYYSDIAKYQHEEELNRIKRNADFEFMQAELNRYIKMYNELKNEQDNQNKTNT